MGAYFSMGPYIRKVLLRMEMGAYIYVVPIFKKCLLSRFYGTDFSLLVRSGLPIMPGRDQRSNPPQSHLEHGQARYPEDTHNPIFPPQTHLILCTGLRSICRYDQLMLSATFTHTLSSSCTSATITSIPRAQASGGPTITLHSTYPSPKLTNFHVASQLTWPVSLRPNLRAMRQYLAFHTTSNQASLVSFVSGHIPSHKAELSAPSPVLTVVLTVGHISTRVPSCPIFLDP